MRNKLVAFSLVSVLALACPSLSMADYVVKDANGGNQTVGAFAPTISGVQTQITKHTLVDPTTGAAIGVSGAPLSSDTVVRATSVDRGGTVTTGGTAQQFMAANTSRRGYIFQNQSSGDLYINCLSTAVNNQTSLRVPSGALYETSPHHSGTGACSVFGATTGQAFYAREF